MKRNVVKQLGMASMIVGTLAFGACGGDDDDGGGDGNATCEGLDGTFTHYVNDAVTVPTGTTGMFDLDNNDRPDNALGGILSALKSQGNVDIQMQINDAITAGELILLHSLHANALDTDTSASWQVYLGDATTAPPKYDGTDAFTVSATGPTDAKLCGKVTGSQFEGGPGNVTIQLSLAGGAPVAVKLTGARIKANVSATGCMSGVLGGGITQTELDGSVLPAIVMLVNDSIKDDAPTAGGDLMPCVAAGDTCPASAGGDATTCDVDRMVCLSSTSQTIADLFDENKDAEVTLPEVKDNDIIKALLAPDVDLLNGTTFDPGKDNTKDSLSIGLQFTCAGGVFTPAGE